MCITYNEGGHGGTCPYNGGDMERVAMDYLSAAQRRIVEYPFARAHMVVLAAPGSGKTRTITERAAHLVASRQISSEQILVLGNQKT